MGRRERDKGIRAERALVNLLDAVGVYAHRVPLSGSMDGYKGDLLIPQWFGDLPVEVKHRNDIADRLWQWMKGRAALFVKRDRRPWLVVMPLAAMVDLINKSQQRR